MIRIHWFGAEVGVSATDACVMARNVIIFLIVYTKFRRGTNDERHEGSPFAGRLGSERDLNAPDSTVALSHARVHIPSVNNFFKERVSG